MQKPENQDGLKTGSENWTPALSSHRIFLLRAPFWAQIMHGKAGSNTD
jgi:hypothetical protein